MARFNSAHRIVKLDMVRQNNIVQVDLNKESSESVFLEEYKKAARIIRNIVSNSSAKTRQDSLAYLGCKSRDCSSCRNRDRRECEGSNMRQYSLTEFQTAIPIIGDRGTGKSSVMCSILESLRCYRGKETNSLFSLDNDVRFIAFDMIDANTLKKPENIMEIILSRMLSYLLDIQSDYDFRELYRQIDELHEDLGLVYWKETGKREGYGLASLQRVADSQKTINSFRKLVEQFTRDVGNCQFGGVPCYLVIALDDIDMYQGGLDGMHDSQFALLEHIYNHMRIPGLIVLMTFNEHVLRKKCDQHFFEVYYGFKQEARLIESRFEDVEELTSQFISKLFPAEQRIYLPNYLVVGAQNESTLYIDPQLTAKEDEKAKADELHRLLGGKSLDKPKKLPVKEFMLRLIAHKTGVYFDAAGTKRHFLEPRNLRELGELFQEIWSMEPIPENKDLQEAVRSQNRQAMLSYLYNQFALRWLSSDEYRRFTRLSTLPLHRQDKALIDQIREHRRALNLTEEHTAYLSKTTRDRWKYSYGELLQNIYFSTRMSGVQGFDRTFYSKEFVQCVLGTHSVIMNQKIAERTDGDGKDGNWLGSVIGSSVAGRWANKMLPNAYPEGSRLVAGPGSLSLPIRTFINWEIPTEIQDMILNLSHNEPSKATRICLRNYLEALTVVGMFFTSVPKSGLKLEAAFGDDEGGKPTLVLCSKSDDHICFNVMNFVINLYDADKDDEKDKDNKAKMGYLSFIRNELISLGKSFVERFTHNWGGELADAINQETEIENQLQQVSQRYISHIERRERERLLNIRLRECKSTIKQAQFWTDLCKDFSANDFTEQWEQIVESVYTQFKSAVFAWHDRYSSRFPMVLPVQHFDMMYNIIKRLASDSYHDKPTEVSLDEVYDCYLQLYDNVSEELQAQDDAYNLKEKDSFVQAFQDSVFYKKFKENKNGNPYIKQIIVAMMKSALTREIERQHVAVING